MTEVVHLSAHGTVATASKIADVLVEGGTVVLPTDTVYGLAACPDDPGALKRLFELKGRDADVPIAVLCGTAVQALSLAGTIGTAAARLAAQHWPGPLTMVLPRRGDLGWALGEPANTIGVRCPDDPVVQAVAARIGPIATTSANRHGDPTPTTADAVVASLLGPVDLVVDGGERPGSASTVVVVDGDRLDVLRPGPLDLDLPRHDPSDSS
ncbi:MAG: L-threonylcarbamoyladenylate synthase [Acidimicrobiales bacterium]|nr:L-threonylcarbamoyladenylate synthase [Acidimicrobiales bacterium]